MSEWIFDRLPTAADADEDHRVWWINPDGVLVQCHYGDVAVVTPGTPWMLVKELEPYVKPTEPQRWKPKLDQGYWAVEHTGVILLQWTGNNSDLSHYHSGNCFQTESQAFEAARRVSKTLLNYHEELNNAE
jgi:hypothetical protein